MENTLLQAVEEMGLSRWAFSNYVGRISHVHHVSVMRYLRGGSAIGENNQKVLDNAIETLRKNSVQLAGETLYYITEPDYTTPGMRAVAVLYRGGKQLMKAFGADEQAAAAALRKQVADVVIEPDAKADPDTGSAASEEPDGSTVSAPVNPFAGNSK